MGALRKSDESSDQQSRSFVDPGQVPFLQGLRFQGRELARAQTDQIGDVANELSGRLGGIGDELLGGLGQQASQFAPGAADSIAGLLGIADDPIAGQLRSLGQGGPLAGQEQLQRIAGGGGGVDLQGLLEPGAQLGGQLDALNAATQRNLQSTLGSLSGQATLAGQVGGDRQAFLSSEAAGRSQEAFASQAGNLLQSDLASRRQLGGVAAGLQTAQTGQQLQAAQALGGQGLAQTGQQAGILSQLLGTQAQGLQAAGGLGLAQQGQNVGAAQAGLGNLSGLFNLGLAPFQAEFQPLQNLAGLIGDPTVLQTGSGKTRKGAQALEILQFGGGGTT
jgi:hypothetical protein